MSFGDVLSAIDRCDTEYLTESLRFLDIHTCIEYSIQQKNMKSTLFFIKNSSYLITSPVIMSCCVQNDFIDFISLSLKMIKMSGARIAPGLLEVTIKDHRKFNIAQLLLSYSEYIPMFSYIDAFRTIITTKGASQLLDVLAHEYLKSTYPCDYHVRSFDVFIDDVLANNKRLLPFITDAQMLNNGLSKYYGRMSHIIINPDNQLVLYHNSHLPNFGRRMLANSFKIDNTDIIIKTHHGDRS